ncbi:CocE/NonD family hydrolase [Rhodococcus sp. B50]|uniref:CocE/NonD family hydrolase n=1 Tax=Rhodococcus sp. B50 TaxID=2682847 RepID=UPI001BD410B8|nr:CocE/NonD family hydrolase [Rhodococcus sp. B50]MBS9376485.1 Cocaine esterase [Rhodococcus sp. B50]
MQEIRIELDVPVPMRDGTVQYADVYRPAAEGKYPVLLTRQPYGKSVTTFLDPKKLVPAGYVVINQDVRGRFGSEGEWIPWKHEREDGYDTVEWAASLPYSTGKVGMFGTSYFGSTQWSAAIAQAPSLRTIVPEITWSDPEDGLMFRGGAIELGLNVYWAFGQGLGQIMSSALDPREKMARFGAAVSAVESMASDTYWQLPSGALPALEALGQPDIGVTRALADPATMDEARVSNRFDNISIPTLNFGGWYDVFLQGTLDNHVGMRSRGQTSRLIVGPWGHRTITNPAEGMIGEVNFGFGSMGVNGRQIVDLHREWYDHWLKDLPATEAHKSGVLLFVMGANEWRAEEEWPLARAQDTALHLSSGGALDWDAPSDETAESGFTYDPADPVMTRGGNLVMAPEFQPGPFNQRDVEARDDVLVFSTEPLVEDLEITGRVRATLYASTDGPSTDWVVRLCEVDSKGISRNIVDGITRVHTQPGRIDEVEVDLWSTSILIKAGHRLRVHVTSSSFPRWDRNLNTGEPVTEATQMRVANNRIYHDASRPSRIILPVVKD